MKLYPDKVIFQLDPRLRQFIHIARVNRRLITLLTDFFAEGLINGDLCIAMLTPRHQRALNRRLKAKGIDTNSAIKNEQFIILNAKDIAPMFGRDEAFDGVAYYNKIEEISGRAAAKDQAVRAFGELIGLGWFRPRLGFYVPQNE